MSTNVPCPHCGNYINPASLLSRGKCSDRKLEAIKRNLEKANQARKDKLADK